MLQTYIYIYVEYRKKNTQIGHFTKDVSELTQLKVHLFKREMFLVFF